MGAECQRALRDSVVRRASTGRARGCRQDEERGDQASGGVGDLGVRHPREG